MIVSRTQEGKEYSRKNNPNFKEGRPNKFTEEQIQLAYELKQQGMTHKMIERKTGISVSTQKRRFNKISNKTVLLQSFNTEYKSPILIL